MASQKKVIVRRFLGDSLPGYLPGSGFVAEGVVALLDLAGHVRMIPIVEIKLIAFVRNFNLIETGEVEKTLRRTFLARPRTEGLWLRVTFCTGDILEGISAPGITMLDEILDLQGLQLIPPDTRANTQRIYIPRPAMQHLDLISVVTSGVRKRGVSRKRVTGKQDELFASADLS